MGAIFGKGAPKKSDDGITEQDKAILKIKTQRDKLKKHSIKIEALMSKEKEAAKTLAKAGQREKAKALLRKRKYQQSMLAKTEGQITNLEAMVQSIEFAKMSNDMLVAMKAGNTALDELQSEYSIDQVEDIMDEARDGVAYADQVNQLLSGKLTNEDEEDVEADLAAFLGIAPEAAAAEPALELPDAPTMEPLPDAPTNVPTAEPVQQADKQKLVAAS